MTMKTYHVTMMFEGCSVERTYEVVAKSEEDAKERFKEHGKCLSETIWEGGEPDQEDWTIEEAGL